MGTALDLFQRVIISTASVTVLAFFDQTPAILGVNYLASLPLLEIKEPIAETAPVAQATEN